MNKYLKLTGLLVVVLLTAVYCSETTGVKPVISNSDKPVISNSDRLSYDYKAALIGSSGHMTITIKPSTEDSIGMGRIDVVMDGSAYTLLPADDKVKNLKKGEALSDAEFSDDHGNTATISLDADGSNPIVDLIIDGHDGEIDVMVFLVGSEVDEVDDVSVYEGIAISAAGAVANAPDNMEDVDPESIITKGTFNIIVKGDKFKFIFKTAEEGPSFCDIDIDSDSSGNAHNQGGDHSNDLNIGGDFLTDSTKNEIALNFIVEYGGGNPSVNIEFPASTLIENELKGYPTYIGQSCVKAKVLNHEHAYDLGGNIKGYNISPETGGGHLICEIVGDDKFYPECPLLKASQQPLAEDGQIITSGDPKYYIDGEPISDTFFIWFAKKTL